MTSARQEQVFFLHTPSGPLYKESTKVVPDIWSKHILCYKHHDTLPIKYAETSLIWISEGRLQIGLISELMNLYSKTWKKNNTHRQICFLKNWFMIVCAMMTGLCEKMFPYSECLFWRMLISHRQQSSAGPDSYTVIAAQTSWCQCKQQPLSRVCHHMKEAAYVCDKGKWILPQEGRKETWNAVDEWHNWHAARHDDAVSLEKRMGDGFSPRSSLLFSSGVAASHPLWSLNYASCIRLHMD